MDLMQILPWTWLFLLIIQFVNCDIEAIEEEKKLELMAGLTKINQLVEKLRQKKAVIQMGNATTTPNQTISGNDTDLGSLIGNF